MAGQEEEDGEAAGGWDEEAEDGGERSTFDMSPRPRLSSTKWDGRLETEGRKARGPWAGGCFLMARWWDDAAAMNVFPSQSLNSASNLFL